MDVLPGKYKPIFWQKFNLRFCLFFGPAGSFLTLRFCRLHGRPLSIQALYYAARLGCMRLQLIQYKIWSSPLE